MSEEQLTNWLDELKRIWEEIKPNEIISLCADEFKYYETPFSLLTTKEQLLIEWKTIEDHKNVNLDYEILSIVDNVGFAHWHATFTRKSTGEIVELDGIYKVVLNENGKCEEFRQWYNAK